ncbi:hypothetical protein ACFYWY_09510 [Streptomyces sp. NPDC002870]|uniref:hypothetical protein n=1 Tax=Streptomyces sp. NPDC002870 TaxID=3364666 RepID=UPI0036A97F2B
MSMMFGAVGLGVALIAAVKAVPQRDDARSLAESAAATLAGNIEAREREQLRALIGRDGVRLNLSPPSRRPAPRRGS